MNQPSDITAHVSDADRFELRLAEGRKWEEAVDEWLQSPVINAMVLANYNCRDASGQPPRIRSRKVARITPDMLVLTQQRTVFVEVKSKAGFFVDRDGKESTGIDLLYWQDYLACQQAGAHIVIFFIHRATAEVRVASITELDAHPGKWTRRHPPHPTAGDQGMIYWPQDVGRLVARIVDEAAEERRLRTITRSAPWFTPDQAGSAAPPAP